MKKILALILIAVLMACSFSMAAMAAEDNVKKMYTTQQVSMYSHPNSQSSVVQIVPAGSQVESYETYQNGFTDCVYAKNSGWISSSFLSATKNGNSGGGGQTKIKGKIDQDMKLSQRARVYSSPSTGIVPIATLDALTIVHVNTVDSGWANIDSGSINGYIPTCYFEGWNIPENYPIGSTTWYDGYDWSAVYNFEYYKGNNPDIAAKFGNDANVTIQHFVNVGMVEGRRASANFDVEEYISSHPQLYEKYGRNYPIYYKDACGIPY